jgi:D-alanyl-D-alanine carboxypeptidase/D-alanyl-D-alanine-endopeptidase (penicillin-binding protein 4)
MRSRPSPLGRQARVVLPALAAALAACAPAASTTSAPPPRPVRAFPSAAEVRADLQRFADSLVSAPEWRNAHWGILIVDAERGDTLYSRNAGKLFMPASNQKLLTGAVALARLGPDYRFRTELRAVAQLGHVPVLQDSVLRGDLVVHGTGDPTASDHARGDGMIPLREMADSLRARGVRRITGSLRAGTDALPGAALGYGWAWDDADYPYSAGVDELLFNEGFSSVVVRGGARPGDLVSVSTRPTRTHPIVRVHATTSPAGTRRSLDIARAPGDSGVVVTGTIAAGDSAVLSMTHRDPARAYLEALREALAERGILVEGGVGEPADSAAAAAGTPLVAVQSPPLREIMPLLQKPSQNQIAEILFRTLGREATGVGTPDSARRVVERQLLAWGAYSGGFAVRDGSGLSRHDYVTPETIVRVLAAMRRDTAFAVFHDALPVAGVDGTIASRMKGTPAQGNVHAKTGFVDKARSLSGYVTTADGVPLLFSFLANNWTTPTREVERVQDAIAVRLASVHLRGGVAADGAARPE